MHQDFISQTIVNQFQHSPTSGQATVIEKLASFCLNPRAADIFILKGYAGTGKTSIISALIRSFAALKQQVVILAPTGRAAKVITTYSGYSSFTIHKRIYRQAEVGAWDTKFSLMPNLLQNCFYIVDEASMIANGTAESSNFGSGKLLEDLIKHVYSSPSSKLILVGDDAQLPPVGLNKSPALDLKSVSIYGYPTHQHELTEVVRQSESSGILWNATRVRDLYKAGSADFPKIKLDGFADLKRVDGYEFLEELEDSFSKDGMEESIVLTRSNKAANAYNQGIRQRILYREEEMESGDLIMVVKNNYFWAQTTEGLDFIANGEVAQIQRVYGSEEKYGFRFLNAMLLFPDKNETTLEVKLMLDSINSEAPSLTEEQSKKLYHAAYAAHAHLGAKKKVFEALKVDPYYNALQVKFAYAVTCHKAQGGQWQNVFIDHGYLTDELINTEFIRWLYTAFTRAKEQLYLVNFHANFFEED